MISHISGTLIQKTQKSLVVEVSGIGYTLYATPPTLALYHTGDMVSLWTHLAVRENSMDLYGFKDHEELSFFELLIGISGIGPKGALGILSVADVTTLTKAVGSGDTSYLTKVSGIGKKSAEKIVLELQDKLGSLSQGNEASGLKEKSEALEALVSLGYSLQDARSALKEISGTATTTNELVREALKKLGS